MNLSDICERTCIEGFVIEAFSSLEEAERYYRIAQEQTQENISIYGSTCEQKASLLKDSHMGMKETLFKNDKWNMNKTEFNRIMESNDYYSNDGFYDFYQWKRTSNKNGTHVAWTENGTIQVSGSNQVHSFKVDNKEKLMSYMYENNMQWTKEQFPSTTSSHSNTQLMLKERDVKPVITYPYTTSTLKGKGMHSQASLPSPQLNNSHTICSSDATISENWMKTSDDPNNSYLKESSLSHSWSAVSFASHHYHTWNNSSKPTAAGSCSKLEMSVVQRCENCGREHYGGFASGRFCSSKCARTIGGNARKRQRLEAQGIRFDDNGKPLDPIPKRLRYTPKHNIHREGDKPGKGYRLCVHCNQPTPNRKVKCQYCGEENPNAVGARKLLENQHREGKKTLLTVHSDMPHPTTFTNKLPATWKSTSRTSEENKSESQQENTTRSETEEEDEEELVKDDIQDNNTQHKKQIGFLLNPN